MGAIRSILNNGWRLLAGAALVVFTCALSYAAEEGDALRANPQALPAQPWSFGQSPDRDAALWRKGVAGGSITGRSTPAQNGRAADTTKGIERALKTAEEKERKNSLGLSMRKESTTWKARPGDKSMRPDEIHARDSSNVLGAYADVEATDDLSFRIGPELILKDEGKGEGVANSSQPDSALGMGMNFKLDF